LKKPIFPYLHYLLLEKPLCSSDISDIKTTLAKKAFFIEIEKRALITCPDGCPACLHTRCDIESNPVAATLLLSRHLLSKIIDRVKTPYRIDMENESCEEIHTRILEKLKNNYLISVTFSPENAEAISRALTQLMIDVFLINNQKYSVSLLSSGLKTFNIRNRIIRYEITLICREMYS
jgi:hypothetical protein